MLGGLGADVMEGGNGNDFMSGGVGDDTMDGGADTDIMCGGAGTGDVLDDGDTNALSVDQLFDLSATDELICGDGTTAWGVEATNEGGCGATVLINRPALCP